MIRDTCRIAWCSRTSGSDRIATAIGRFFEAFPSPSAVLEADDGAIQAILHPCGLPVSKACR